MFSSKAEVLEHLSKVGGNFNISPLIFFNTQSWETDKNDQIGRILNFIGEDKDLLAIRSSAMNEDSITESQAGAYESVLNVDPNQQAIAAAIETVISSMPDNLEDQIIVQKMVIDIDMSGVILTRGLDDGTPYYVINYDDQSGRTDTVTGGSVIAKSVLIHATAGEWRLESKRLQKILRTIRELESIIGLLPLDIEFGLDRLGIVHIFQVRRITQESSWDAKVTNYVSQELSDLEKYVELQNQPHAYLAGSSTIFANMTDWNPAEMIGQMPRPLATSLYRKLITRSVWREARSIMGYKPVQTGELMVVLSGHPFIDVRASLNSFLPPGIENDLCHKVVDLQLTRLRKNPDFHDKIEFEVAPTTLSFTTRDELKSWYGDDLSNKERQILIDSLRALTNKLLDPSPTGSLAWAEGKIRDLNDSQMARINEHPTSTHNLLEQADFLLDEATRDGTLPFAILARHGFVAESLLGSAVKCKALTFSRVHEFKQSVKTVAGELADDFHSLWQEPQNKQKVLRRYGHLRPSAYDILSPRYDQRENLFNFSSEPPVSQTPDFNPTATELAELESLIDREGLVGVSAVSFFDYIARAIIGREFGKFVFTRNLSQALEGIVEWGKQEGLDRNTLSFLPIETYNDVIHFNASSRDLKRLKEQARLANENWIKSRWLRLSYIIRDPNDLIIVPSQRTEANFVGDQRLEASVIPLSVQSDASEELEGKIVCIENADPGFDWVFTQGITGLITRYGGANSHMAIRCAEFGLPAAIGCGELMYNRVVNAEIVELSCFERKIRVIR